MKISEAILIGIMLLPLVLIVTLAVWVGFHVGGEAGLIAGFLGFIFFGGIESAGFGFFALFKKFAETDRKRGAEFDWKSDS